MIYFERPERGSAIEELLYTTILIPLYFDTLPSIPFFS